MPAVLETNKSKMKRIRVTIDHSGNILEKDEKHPTNAKNNRKDDVGGTGLPDKASE